LACSTANRSCCVHGSPWPTSVVATLSAARASSDASALALSAVAAPATICGPVLPVYGLTVTNASPAMSAPRSGKCRAVPVGVAGREDDVRAAGDVELLVGTVGLHLLGALDPKGALGAHGDEDLQKAWIACIEQPATLVVEAPRVLRHRHLALVGPDRHAELRPCALGEAHVVEVRVGEHDRVDFGQ
jgi:hypothetical protein